MKFSSVVKSALKQKDVSVVELAKSINISVAYMYDLLKGKKRWNEPTMNKVVEVLGIKVEYEILD